MSDYLSSDSEHHKKKKLAYLPPEVITLILRGLPVKSVVKCTSVCKTWYALIKRSSFISTHLQAASLHNNLILLCFPESLLPEDPLTSAYQLHVNNDSFEEYKKFKLPSKPDVDRCFIVGTCNGLVCLADIGEYFCNIILWNPTIQKHLILPNPDLPKDLPRESYYFYTVGFGFDSVSGDYKVLLILPEGHTENVAEVWLFSLNRHSWMRLTDVYPNHGCYGSSKAVFVNGALHYGLFSHMILAFDISTEEFFEINIPKTLVDFAHGMSLLKYEESIALVNHGNFHIKRHELWVMKDYGVDNSWKKVLHLIEENGELAFGRNMMVLGVRRHGKLLLNVERDLEHGYELATLDVNCHQQENQKQLEFLGGPDSMQYMLFDSYMESLVLFDKGEKDIVAEENRI